MNLTDKLKASYWHEGDLFATFKCCRSDGDLSNQEIQEGLTLFAPQIVAEAQERDTKVARQKAQAKAMEEQQRHQQALQTDLLAKHGAPAERLLLARIQEAGNDRDRPATLANLHEEGDTLIAELAEAGYSPRRWAWNADEGFFRHVGPRQADPATQGAGYSKAP